MEEGKTDGFVLCDVLGGQELSKTHPEFFPPVLIDVFLTSLVGNPIARLASEFLADHGNHVEEELVVSEDASVFGKSYSADLLRYHFSLERTPAKVGSIGLLKVAHGDGLHMFRLLFLVSVVAAPMVHHLHAVLFHHASVTATSKLTHHFHHLPPLFLTFCKILHDGIAQLLVILVPNIQFDLVFLHESP